VALLVRASKFPVVPCLSTNQEPGEHWNLEGQRGDDIESRDLSLQLSTPPVILSLTARPSSFQSAANMSSHADYKDRQFLAVIGDEVRPVDIVQQKWGEAHEAHLELA